MIAIKRGVLFCLCIAGLVFNVARAQAPQRITAAFDDWTILCSTAPAASGQKSCQLIETQRMKGQPNIVGQITISQPAKDKPYKIFFQVPANVWMQSGIKFVAQLNQAPLIAQFRWCLPSRCLADADLTVAMVGKFGSYPISGTEQYKDAAQHDVSLPVSFKGFGPALDWMEKQ